MHGVGGVAYRNLHAHICIDGAWVVQAPRIKRLCSVCTLISIVFIVSDRYQMSCFDESDLGSRGVTELCEAFIAKARTLVRYACMLSQGRV
jgi:hypothetical protein